jgi:hypothetical protein
VVVRFGGGAPGEFIVALGRRLDAMESAVPDDAAVLLVAHAEQSGGEVAQALLAVLAGEPGVVGAVPVAAVADTVKVLEDGYVVGTADRNAVRDPGTPQAYRAGVLRDVLRSLDPSFAGGHGFAKSPERWLPTMIAAVGPVRQVEARPRS